MLLPLAAVGAAAWMTAEGRLEKELGRKPTENEVRAKLGYPLVVGRVTNRYLDLGIMAGGSMPIPDTRFRLDVAPAADGRGVTITLLEVA
jgi:hypothetical protein